MFFTKKTEQDALNRLQPVTGKRMSFLLRDTLSFSNTLIAGGHYNAVIKLIVNVTIVNIFHK